MFFIFTEFWHISVLLLLLLLLRHYDNINHNMNMILELNKQRIIAYQA